ncbi:MAG TPA: MMPL family transporter [Gaiellales bacterium]|nr:MMPL family transporter [Gaiellales bacterium]
MTSQTESPALARLTRFSLRHRRLVVAFWAILTIAGIAASGRAFNAFSDQYSVPGREGYETNTAITRLFGNGGNSAPIVAVVHLPRGTTVGSPGIRAAIGRVDRRIGSAVAGVRVASYASTASRAFVSADGRTTFVLAYAPPEAGSFGGSPQATRAVSGAVRGLEVGGSPVHVTGLDALDASSTGSGGLGILAEALLGGVGALLVLAFVFASFLAFVPLVVALCSIMTTLLLVWGLTTVASVSGIVGFLIVLVGLGVAVDYSLLIIVRWREERSQGQAPEAAIERAMTAAGRAVVFSGTTVAIGLLSLLVLPVPFLRSVGYGGLLIPLISVAVALTLIPVILASLGPRLDWPHLRSDDRASRVWSSWAAAVVRRRWLAAGVAVAVLAGLTLAATALRLGPPDGNPDVISRQGDARAGLSLLERAGLGQGILTPIEILTPRGRAEAVAARAGSVAGTSGAAAPGGPRWQRAGSAVVDVFPASESSATVNAVGDAAHTADPEARVGGIVAQNSDFSSAVYGGFPLMVGLIALLTFVLLARAFRSLLLPLKAVLLNVLSVAAAWGVVVLVWQKGFGSQLLWGIGASGSIPSWLPLMVFAFLYGLSMDYEVFILARMREEYDRTGSTEQAVIDGIGRTGRLVTSAALILFLGFVAMSSAPSTEAKMIATGLGAGILFDATVIRALLVPAAVALLGRWNWWLPRPVARVLRVREAEARA